MVSWDGRPLFRVPATAHSCFPDFRHLPFFGPLRHLFAVCREAQNGGHWVHTQWSPLIRGFSYVWSAAVQKHYMSSSRNKPTNCLFSSVGSQVHPTLGGVMRAHAVPLSCARPAHQPLRSCLGNQTGWHPVSVPVFGSPLLYSLWPRTLSVPSVAMVLLQFSLLPLPVFHCACSVNSAPSQGLACRKTSSRGSALSVVPGVH